MSKLSTNYRCVLTAFLVLLLTAGSSWACSVPVFRYALERWPADYYQALVFYRSELTKEQKAIVDLLSEEGLAGKSFANIYAVTVDLDAEQPKKVLEFWEKNKSETLPWMVVRYPWQTQIPVPVWKGPLDKNVIPKLVDSPMRRDIARRILKGETAVWVLLESGNKKQDDAAFRLIKKQLAVLQKQVELPAIDPADIAMGYLTGDPEDLKVQFSLTRLSRKNPAETMFVEQLLGTEPDLREFKEPMVFPIFGRGRALFALVGKGINEDNIAEAVFILTGPCTCTIKAQNPGTDLIIAVDWDSLIIPEVEIDEALPPLSGLGQFGAEKKSPAEKKTKQSPPPPSTPKKAKSDTSKKARSDK